VGKISALLNPLTYVLINLALLWLIDIGALRVESGNLTQGQVLALYNYMSQILVELIKLANLIVSISKALASAGRISTVLNITSSEPEGSLTERDTALTPVQLIDASLCYSCSKEPSVHGVTFTAERGETIGIIGGTGSGKTSLINLIPGLYTPSSGRVLLWGKDTTEYKTNFLREKIAVVPQKATLFSGTIRENMQIGNKDASDEEICDALKIAQAYEVVKEKGGLDSFVEVGGANFSGGQKQRLTIARALMRKPEILILDDSASALDFATDAALRLSIKEKIKDTVVFIVSQRASSIMHADKILVLDDGEVVGHGTHEELLLRCQVYCEIYESQFGEVKANA
jgi:ABC-type multidrug transport system fused ATPase/permease subunit